MRKENIFGGIDWSVVLVYLILVTIGYTAIYAVSFSELHPMMYDLSQKYGMQLIWISLSIITATVILLLEDRFIHMMSLPVYILVLLVLFAVPFVGKEINGARSWFQLGPISIQPSEFAKFATGLAVARYMSLYTFSLKRFKSLFTCCVIAFTPAVAIMLQPDAGSALVYGAFIIVLYREGFAKWPYLVLGGMIVLFLLSFIIELTPLLLLIFLFLLLWEGISMSRPQNTLAYGGAVLLVWVLLNIICQFFNIDLHAAHLLIISVVLVAPFVMVNYVRQGVAKIPSISLITFFGASLFLSSVDFVFNNVMRIHQRKRILDMLGLESDVKGWGYNLNQSKIAIGSGGFSGKGFLQGTQTKLDFVPEQSTDFIFCTIGEEWGFMGCATVVLLFAFLIFKLIRMAESQKEPFGRVYCYYVASIFTVHLCVNVGMTIGIMPVIGIPLPFFSYGGSSLIAFTILLFIAIRLDSRRNQMHYF